MERSRSEQGKKLDELGRFRRSLRRSADPAVSKGGKDQTAPAAELRPAEIAVFEGDEDLAPLFAPPQTRGDAR